MANSAGQAGNEHAAEFLSVQIGAQEFAIGIKSIREIRGWIASTRLAHAPDFIKGMINLRGQVLVVVDLAKRLGLPASEPGAASVVVVVENGGRTVGLLVDAVCDIISVPDEMRQNTPETGSDRPKSFIDGLMMLDGRIISIVSIPVLIPDENLQAMAELEMAG